MAGAFLLLTFTAVMVDYGWESVGPDQYRYVVQVPPEQLETLREGAPFTSRIPAELRGKVTEIEIRVGTEPLRQDPVIAAVDMRETGYNNYPNPPDEQPRIARGQDGGQDGRSFEMPSTLSDEASRMGETARNALRETGEQLNERAREMGSQAIDDLANQAQQEINQRLRGGSSAAAAPSANGAGAGGAQGPTTSPPAGPSTSPSGGPTTTGRPTRDAFSGGGGFAVPASPEPRSNNSTPTANSGPASPFRPATREQAGNGTGQGNGGMASGGRTAMPPSPQANAAANDSATQYGVPAPLASTSQPTAAQPYGYQPPASPAANPPAPGAQTDPRYSAATDPRMAPVGGAGYPDYRYSQTNNPYASGGNLAGYAPGDPPALAQNSGAANGAGVSAYEEAGKESYFAWDPKGDYSPVKQRALDEALFKEVGIDSKTQKPFDKLTSSYLAADDPRYDQVVDFLVRAGQLSEADREGLRRQNRAKLERRRQLEGTPSNLANSDFSRLANANLGGLPTTDTSSQQSGQAAAGAGGLDRQTDPQASTGDTKSPSDLQDDENAKHLEAGTFIRLFLLVSCVANVYLVIVLQRLLRRYRNLVTSNRPGSFSVG